MAARNRPPVGTEARSRAPLARLPAALVAFRVLLAPVVIVLAKGGRQGIPMAVVILCALLSDIYDGIIARKLGVETTALRRVDSVADTIFYAATAIAAWVLAPRAVLGVGRILLLLVFLEIARYCFDYAKFHREASYHSYGAKLWGLMLASALVLLLAFNISGWFLRAAIWIGIISDLEGLAISIILPAWSHDVPSVFHAFKLRRLTSANQGVSAGSVL
jgi:phosphatidylglycerophosphate synthase